ncbi:DUF4288 domain-containing protein [Streptomyces pathocidini]|uniref:DUF4288 domain-containing protein n=1 Tax=Streptomyces pathocidini TaxID=1650571 RepID=UPI0033DD1B6E
MTSGADGGGHDRPEAAGDGATVPYVAIVLMEASSDRAGHPPLFQENVVLVHARDEEAARDRVELRARRAETSYLNDQGETVTWKLRTVVDVREAEDPDLTRDADLYSRHFRDYASYERFEPLLSGEEI